MSSATRPSTDRRRCCRGVSLLEAVAATGVLAVCLLGLAGNAVTLTRASKSADGSGTAIALAQKKIEQLRSMPLGATALTPGSYQDGTSLAADGRVGGPYQRSWVVSGRDLPRYGLKTVTVTVAWTDAQSHAVQLAAYVRCSTVPCP